MSRPAFTMTNLLNLTRTTLYSPVAGTGRLVAAGRGARPAEDVARHPNVDVVFRFARDSPLEESGFEPLVPLRPGRFSEHHSRVVTAPSSIRKAGYAQACAARDGQRTCRGPGPPAHREDVYFRIVDFFGGADFFRGAAFGVGGLRASLT